MATHEVLPIPFNQPLIATPANPVNGQMYSYGGVSSPLNLLHSRADVHQPVLRQCADPRALSRLRHEFGLVQGRGHLQLQRPAASGAQAPVERAAIHRRRTPGRTLSTSRAGWACSSPGTIRWSEIQLCVVGLRSNARVPGELQLHDSRAWPRARCLGELINGWIIGGQTVAQSGQPYSVYDYSGSVGSLYFGTNDYIGNPIVPLARGVTPKQAQLQGTTGVNAGKPVLNSSDFLPQFVAPAPTECLPATHPGAIFTSPSTAARAGTCSVVPSRCALI